MSASRKRASRKSCRPTRKSLRLLKATRRPCRKALRPDPSERATGRGERVRLPIFFGELIRPIIQEETEDGRNHSLARQGAARKDRRRYDGLQEGADGNVRRP